MSVPRFTIISPTAASSPSRGPGSDVREAKRRSNTIDIAAIERRLRDDRPAHLEIAGLPTTLERISDALASPRMFIFYLGFYAGCLATVGVAFLWSAR